MQANVTFMTMPPKDTAGDYLIDELNDFSKKPLQKGPTTSHYDTDSMYDFYDNLNMSEINRTRPSPSPSTVLTTIQWQLNQTTVAFYQVTAVKNATNAEEATKGLATSTIVLISIVIVLIILMLLTLIYYILRPNDRSGSGSPEDATAVEGTYVRETNKVVVSKQQQQPDQGSANTTTIKQQTKQVATSEKQIGV